MTTPSGTLPVDDGAADTVREIAQQPGLWREVDRIIAASRESLDAFLRPLLARDDLRVVLTGASRGLGRLLAHAFSQAGAHVALVARTEVGDEEVAEELPGPSLDLSGDLTDEAFNEAVADATVAEWGGVDVWICNAGISPVVAGPLDTDPSVWRKVLDVNLMGAFLCIRAIVPVMRLQELQPHRGHILNVASIQGKEGMPFSAAYSTSKAGLMGLTKSAGKELAQDAILDPVSIPPLDGVHHLTVYQHREVQVVAPRQPGHAASAERAFLVDHLTRLHVHRGKVRVQ